MSLNQETVDITHRFCSDTRLRDLAEYIEEEINSSIHETEAAPFSEHALDIEE
jgi:hypothetical protein